MKQLTETDLRRLWSAELTRLVSIELTSIERHQSRRLHLTFNRRMTVCAGRAFQSGKVELAPKVLCQPYVTEAEAIEIIRHEIAHVLAPANTGHSKVWKAVARRIGSDATRCHSLATPCAPKRWSYWRINCTGCGRLLTARPYYSRTHPGDLVEGKSTKCCGTGATVAPA